ncbi:hypothetical protein BU24DRAFT_386447 [Aaosphaeria arxii CBS 175.79]|uniref:ARCA-like protein n=1 Tax=Aaosphaeria arxii CBS 175.79 TaxID=1450172 RepID=A0A6A5Y3S2_9PLEO|nr:uncharacterized protein BU24DRAFT_386447 [Aaosphaeria arxii CBS 175.79]KAF2019511.1 hypothetical protein BU24DRAFT_386447 [Aaosphaeria arxii CBS 175.79]
MFDQTEACLMRYFIEEISPWFDTCDVRKHFQYYIPERARYFQPLCNAIFATSARHLHRLPQHRTPGGICYQGQILTNLTPHVAVEYMLKCLPALRSFHEIQDDDQRDLIIATAIILRQFEEIEDVESINIDEALPEGSSTGGVNFLDIINTVLRSSHIVHNPNGQGLIHVVYWISLRQEVYSAFMGRRSPQMLLSQEHWNDAEAIDKTIMHAAQVAKWLFDDGSENEWYRLKEQEQLLESIIQTLPQFLPILWEPPNKSRGEVFPIVWLGSDLAITGIQHVIISKMVLTAEDPNLKSEGVARGAHRQVESKVRKLVLDLCGMARSRPQCPPALVNAAMGILHYGHFFTDEWELQALRAIITKFEKIRAWPVPKELSTFC